MTVILIPLIRSKLNESQNAKMSMWIGVAVAAAEQIFRQNPGAGEQKKQFVLNYLEDKGFTYDSDAVDLMIEAAVKQLNIAQQ